MTSPTQGEHAQTALRLADEYAAAHAKWALEDLYGSSRSYTSEKLAERHAARAKLERALHAQVAALTPAQPAAPQGVAYAELPDVDALAQEIRRVDGSHNLGAGALAEALMPFLRASNGQAPAGAAVYPGCSHWGMRDTPATAQAAPAAGAVAGPVKQCAGIPRPGCDYMAECGSVCRKCGKVHSAHLLMFDAPQPRWASYEVAVSDPVFQVARSIMGTENLGQDRQLVAAINHVLAAAPTPAAQADSVLEDVELGRIAMRFVDRAGDPHPGIDDAETICREFHAAMSAVLDPRFQRRMDAARKQGGTHDNH